MQNIMLDLECLSSANTAAIVSIGAVFFDVSTKKLGGEFYCEISTSSLDDQIKRGAAVSASTVQWWLRQHESVSAVLRESNANRSITERALNEFALFLRSMGPNPGVWGNGADYDNAVLRNCYMMYNIKSPWRPQQNRCYRTIYKLHNKPNRKVVRSGTHHNALDDAKTQALQLINLLHDQKVNI